MRNTELGRLDGHAVGLRLSTGTVEQNLDAAVFWYSSRPDEGPRINHQSPMGLELQRRQRLAEATTAFRGGKIRFGAETAAILPASEPALQTVLAEVQRDSTLTLLVKAFADARETDGVQLSWKRARVVKDWLVTRRSPATASNHGAAARLAHYGSGRPKRSAPRIEEWRSCESRTGRVVSLPRRSISGEESVRERLCMGVTRSPASNVATRLTAGSPTFWSSPIRVRCAIQLLVVEPRRLAVQQPPGGQRQTREHPLAQSLERRPLRQRAGHRVRFDRHDHVDCDRRKVLTTVQLRLSVLLPASPKPRCLPRVRRFPRRALGRAVRVTRASLQR